MSAFSASTLLLASSLTVMAGAILAPALPGLKTAFAHEAGVELLARLVLTMPALAVALGAALMGWMVDRVGRRKVLLVGLVVYGAGGASGLFLDGLYAILAGRFVLGLGVAAVMTAATTLIADLTTGPARGRFMGLQAAFMGLGGLVFLALGGFLSDLDWRWPFAIYLSAFLLVPASLLSLPPGKPEAAGRGQVGRIPTAVWGLYALGLVGMLLFYMVPVQLPFLLSQRLQASGIGVGLALGVMTVIASTVSFFFSRLQRRFGSPAVLVATFAMMAPGLALVAWSSSWPGVLAGQAVFGVGVGLLLPNLNLWASELAPEAARGRVLGGLTTFIFLGQFLSPVVASPALSAGVSLGQLFYLCAGVAILFAIGSSLLRWQRPQGAAK